MHLAELENSLPNGFHDAKIESLTVDYVAKRATIRFRLLTGLPDAPRVEDRESYMPVTLELLDLVYFVIERPDTKRDIATIEELWIDGGEAGAGPGPGPLAPLDQLSPGTFAYWLFVKEWNSFMHFAARDASLSVVE